MNQVRRGTVLAFNSAAWTATVMLDGADTESQMPVGQWVPATMMVANAEVAVLVFEDQSTNTDDGVVLGAYGAVGTTDTPTFAGLNVSTVIRIGGLATEGLYGEITASIGVNNTAIIMAGKAPRGLMVVLNRSSGKAAIIGVTASGAVTTLISDLDSVFSITQGTAGKNNVYWTGGNLTIENKTGGASIYTVTFIGYSA